MSVETEAGLSNGSGYYYPELIDKIAMLKHVAGSSVSICCTVNWLGKWEEKPGTPND
jgi:hypothetical protein